MSNLEAALKLSRERKWRVFPCHTPTGKADRPCSCNKPDCQSIGKHPRITGGVNAASTDEAVIRRWWETWPIANIGIACGMLSGLVVLDIDGPEGEHALKVNGHEVGDTLEVKTGRGRHLYYAHPGLDLRGFAGRLPKVDCRAEGGYVIGPPSLHASGKIYEFTDETMELAPPPKWFIDIIMAGQKTGQRPEKVGDDEPLKEGSRNDQLYRVACKWRAQGMSRAEILDFLRGTNSRRCQPPLGESELATIATSAAKHDPDTIGLDFEGADMVALLRASGAGAKAVEAVAKDLEVKAELREGLDLSLIRATHGPGKGGKWDVTIYYDSRVVTICNVAGAQLLSFQQMRARALDEGMYLESGGAMSKQWKALVRDKVKDPTLKVVERLPEEDIVQAIATCITDHLDELRKIDDVEAFLKSPSSYTLALKEGLAFNYSDMWRYVKREIPDAGRSDYGKAQKQLGVRIFVPKRGNPARKQLRLIPRVEG